MEPFIKQYTLPSGKTFETITIPKGTLLFHGIEEKRHHNEYFEYFTGWPTPRIEEYSGVKYKIFEVSPHSQMFFYPAPYASDAVNKFNIHMLCYTLYDLELMLLVLPANDSREEYPSGDPLTDAYVTCSILSETDPCGFPMDDQNPCFTQATMDLLPHLNGYIAISGTDAGAFRTKMAASMRAHNKSFLANSLPFIISNSRVIQSVPEIAIHPLYRRDQNCLEFSPQRIHSDFKHYLVKNKASYAIYPLYIFSDNGALSLNDFLQLDYHTLSKFLKSNDRAIYAQRPLYKQLKMFISAALEPDGYIYTPAPVNSDFGEGYTQPNNQHVRISIDSRTGFYILDSQSAVNDLPENITYNARIHSDFIIPFTLPANSKSYIRAHLTRNLPYLRAYFKRDPLIYEANLEMFFNQLKAAGINGRPYVFSKGDGEKYVRGYHVEELIHNVRQRTHRTRRRGGGARQRQAKKNYTQKN